MISFPTSVCRRRRDHGEVENLWFSFSPANKRVQQDNTLEAFPKDKTTATGA
jgi:hypothetical protein